MADILQVFKKTNSSLKNETTLVVGLNLAEYGRVRVGKYVQLHIRRESQLSSKELFTNDIFFIPKP